jgi:hypothetical protein
MGCSLPSFGSGLYLPHPNKDKQHGCSLPSFGSGLYPRRSDLKWRRGCSLPSFGSGLYLARDKCLIYFTGPAILDSDHLIFCG